MIRELWKPGMAVRLVGVAVTGFHEQPCKQEALFAVDDFAEDPKPSEGQPRLTKEQSSQLARATDIVKDRFGESAVFFGREFHVRDNTTGSAAKNPADYLK